MSYRKQAKGKPRCGVCGEIIHGTARNRSPSRPYGGSICGSCLKSLLTAKVRSPP